MTEWKPVMLFGSGPFARALHYLIRDSMTIGEGSAIGAGATIIANTAPWSIHAAPSTRALPGRSDRLPRF
jgi:hypothetical protein